jgi:hypothetical protein
MARSEEDVVTAAVAGRSHSREGGRQALEQPDVHWQASVDPRQAHESGPDEVEVVSPTCEEVD